MSLRDRRPADLFDLIDELRRGGFNVGAEQYLATQKLLAALAVRGAWPHHPERLGGLLAPILCTTPEEQATFQSYYEKWLKLNPGIFSGETRSATASEGGAHQPGAERPDSRRTALSKWMIAFGLSLATALLVVVWWYFSSPTPITLRGTALERGRPVPRARVTLLHEDSSIGGVAYTDDVGRFVFNYTDEDLPVSLRAENDETSTVGSLTVEDSTTTDVQVILSNTSAPAPTPTASLSLLETLLIGAVLATAAALLVWAPTWLWRYWHILGLKKWRTKQRIKTEHLIVKGASEQLTRLLSLRRTAQDLRRHRLLNAHDLDVSRTVYETVWRGLFTPTYASRRSSLEYLVLIDRANFSDQQAQLVTQVMKHLAKNSVFIDSYYFQGDPRICRKDGPQPQNWTLKELAAKHPEHYLLIFSDAAGMFNPLTGQPQRWIESFSPWAMRAVLTSELEMGGYREWVLNEAGFIVAPANKTGISLIGETIHIGSKNRERSHGRIKPLPEMLRRRPNRWMEEHPPSPTVFKELRQQLRSFLGDEGYFWLSACAVYPMLYWDITLYLGYQLVNQNGFEEKFSTLVRLPWFRQGSMPDWLREFLITGLSTDDERCIRRALESLLLSSLTKSDGFLLPITRQPRAERDTWLRRVRTQLTNRVTDWRRRRHLMASLKAEPGYSLPQDYVLLSFLSGRKLPRLALRFPDELDDIFFAGQSYLDLFLVRMMPPFTIAFAIALPVFTAVVSADIFMSALAVILTVPWAALLTYPLLQSGAKVLEETGSAPTQDAAVLDSTGASPEQGGFSEPGLADDWPVVVGRPLLAEEPLHGREKLLAKILTHLRRFRPVNLVSEQRMGRTSLLNHLLAHAETRLEDNAFRPLPVYIDLQASGFDVRRFYGTVLRELLSKIAVTQPQRWAKLRSRLSTKPVASFDELLAVLEKIKKGGQNFHPIILVDEFEVLLAPSAGPDLPIFFDRLRALMSARLLTMIVASVRPLAEYQDSKVLFNQSTSPFTNIFTTMRLTPLNEAAAKEMLRHVSASQLTESEINEAIKWAGGHPCLLQAAAAAQHEAKLNGYSEEWVYERREALKLQNCATAPRFAERSGKEIQQSRFVRLCKSIHSFLRRALKVTSRFVKNSYEAFFDLDDIENARSFYLSTWSTIWLLFVRPARVFVSFRTKPRFFWACVICLAAITISVLLLYQRLGGYENLIRAGMKANPASAQFNPALIEEVIQLQSEYGLPYILMIMPVAVEFLVFILGAGLYFIGVRALRGLITYKQTLSIFIYSSLPEIVILALSDVAFQFLYFGSSIDLSRFNYDHFVQLNMGMLVDQASYPIIEAILSNVDLLRFYGLILAGLGIRKIAKLPWAKCWIIVIAVWLIDVIRYILVILFTANQTP